MSHTLTIRKQCAAPIFADAWRRFGLALALQSLFSFAYAQSTAPTAAATLRVLAPAQDYVPGAGDVIKISVFQNPDLSLETRVSENGTISYPLIGTVPVGGSSTAVAERQIATKLKERAFSTTRR